MNPGSVMRMICGIFYVAETIGRVASPTKHAGAQPGHTRRELTGPLLFQASAGVVSPTVLATGPMSHPSSVDNRLMRPEDEESASKLGV